MAVRPVAGGGRARRDPERRRSGGLEPEDIRNVVDERPRLAGAPATPPRLVLSHHHLVKAPDPRAFDAAQRIGAAPRRLAEAIACIVRTILRRASSSGAKRAR